MSYNDLIEGLIETNKQHRKHMQQEDKYYFSPLHYALEFCTVTCDIGGGVGKTTFIKTHAKHGDLVMVANDVLKRTLYGRNTEFDIVSSFDELDKVRGRKYKTIFIDDPISVFKEKEWLIETYQAFIDPYGNQTFVLLGRLW